jgi:hypothetical protein
MFYRKTLMVFKSDFNNFPDSGHNSQTSANPLVNYLQLQSPEIMAKVARSVSSNVKEIISQNVQGLVGMLPSEGFSIQITTERDDLAGLLASAMMTGYFLRQMEQRMELEETFSGTTSMTSRPPNDSAP